MRASVNAQGGVFNRYAMGAISLVRSLNPAHSGVRTLRCLALLGLMILGSMILESSALEEPCEDFPFFHKQRKKKISMILFITINKYFIIYLIFLLHSFYIAPEMKKKRKKK